MRLDDLRAGTVVHVDREASVQFAPGHAIRFRLIRWESSDYDGWIWTSGYQLNEAGDAIDRRELFLQYEGLRPVADGPLTRRCAPNPTSSAGTPSTRRRSTTPAGACQGTELVAPQRSGSNRTTTAAW